VVRERGRGQLEQEILACLASSGTPMTPAEVLDDLGQDLAYTTVMTTLSRMFAKHALVREPRGRAYAYSLPAGVGAAHASMTAFHMQRLLDGDDDRAGVLAQFVAHLEPEDEQVLARLLTGTPPTTKST
jgi:predicted transcriptional regulator